MTSKKKTKTSKGELAHSTDPILKEIEDDLLERSPKLFEGIPKDKKELLLRQFSLTIYEEKIHSGPLPDPDTLGKYDSIISSGADRIMAMAEKQQAHRIAIEASTVKSLNKQSANGQILGFLIGIFGLACGTFLAYHGQTTVGSIIAGGTVVSLVGAFVYGKNAQKTKNND